jgi:hypothetical protein
MSVAAGLHPRGTPHGNYVIFFRYVADTLEVVDVLEAHRDMASHFKTRS